MAQFPPPRGAPQPEQRAGLTDLKGFLVGGPQRLTGPGGTPHAQGPVLDRSKPAMSLGDCRGGIFQTVNHHTVTPPDESSLSPPSRGAGIQPCPPGSPVRVYPQHSRGAAAPACPAVHARTRRTHVTRAGTRSPAPARCPRRRKAVRTPAPPRGCCPEAHSAPRGVPPHHLLSRGGDIAQHL